MKFQVVTAVSYISTIDKSKRVYYNILRLLDWNCAMRCDPQWPEVLSSSVIVLVTHRGVSIYNLAISLQLVAFYLSMDILSYIII